MTPLTEWQVYYSIVGSAAGALIGLQFVVMALISSLPGIRNMATGGQAFVTPTIVHFASALFLACLVTAPWRSITHVAILWAVAGIFGVLYTLIVILRMRRQAAYKPELEDWLFHAILPAAAYVTLIAAACFACSFTRPSLFVVAAASSLLLFIGIHNAWDNVAYHVVVKHLDPHDQN
jgi:hypothetical protein